MENRIRSERALLNMSQDDLAEILSVHRNTIRKWENDVSECPISKVWLMSKTFDCTIDYLICKSEVRRDL